MTDVKPKVVAVIPCYNTAPHITEVVSKARQYVDQVIVVDDGSTDDTAEVARKAGALVLSHDKNRGKGAAMKYGAQQSHADILIFIDGDGQHDPSEIPVLLKPLFDNQADLVIGSRHMNNSINKSAPIARRAANTFASTIISAVIQMKGYNDRYQQNYKKITDCTSGFRALKKEKWDRLQLLSNNYQIETEITFESAKCGLIITEVPIHCIWGNSSTRLSIVGDGFRTISLILKK